MTKLGERNLISDGSKTRTNSRTELQLNEHFGTRTVREDTQSPPCNALQRRARLSGGHLSYLLCRQSPSDSWCGTTPSGSFRHPKFPRHPAVLSSAHGRRSHARTHRCARSASGTPPEPRGSSSAALANARHQTHGTKRTLPWRRSAANVSTAVQHPRAA
jgi:hypothetical protein